MFNGPDSINGGDYEEEPAGHRFVLLLRFVLMLNALSCWWQHKKRH